MTTEQLQHLGCLLVSGEDNALLARELMIGQGIWNVQGVCDCLNAVAPVQSLFYVFRLTTAERWEIDYDISTASATIYRKYAVPSCANFRPRDSIFQLVLLMNHHNPTAPTISEQTSAGAPSGIC